MTECADGVWRSGYSGRRRRLEKLNRYESHLDREFESTLAMLFKLKELRAGK